MHGPKKNYRDMSIAEINTIIEFGNQDQVETSQQCLNQCFRNGNMDIFSKVWFYQKD